MGEYDLYMLTKQKYEAQLKLEALQYQERLNAINKTLNELDNTLETHRSNVKQIGEILKDFSENSQKIAETLESENYIKIDRESGLHLKNIFEKGLEVLNTKFTDKEFFDETKEEETDPFLQNATTSLQKTEKMLTAATGLASFFHEEENSNSTTDSEDTIATIASDKVTASSPL